METEDKGVLPAEDSRDITWRAKLWAMGLKAANHISPLMIYRLGKGIQFTTMFLLFLSFWSGFLYVLFNYSFNCNERNGCKICTVAVLPEGECSVLSSATVDLSGSCISMSPVNSYADIEKAATLDIDEAFSVYFLEGLSPSFRHSLNLHRTIWPCFEGGQRFGRLSTPDPACVRRYYNNLEMGQRLGLIGGGPVSLTDEDMAAYGIVVLKSLHSLVTLMNSVNQQQQYLLATNGSSIAGSFYQVDSDTGVEHQLFQSAGCFIQAPSGTKGIMSTIISDCLKIDGAGSPIISIPSSYVVNMGDDIVSNIQFAVEGRLFTGTRSDVETGSRLESRFRTCTDTAVLSTRVASYDSGLYHCCVTKNVIDMLGEGFGFASFTLTLGLILTTPLFFPFQKKLRTDFIAQAMNNFQGNN